MKIHRMAAVTAVGLLVLPSQALAQQVPSYYPTSYSEIIEESRNEDGLLVYSNMSPENWKPMISGFSERFPWIEVETLDLGSGEVFSRFEAEAASSVETADLLVSVSPDRWIDIAERGLLAEYESPEKPHLPDFAATVPGVYTLSTDPLVLIYNQKLLSETERPTSLRSLVDIATTEPARFGNRIASYEATDGAFALTVWRATMYEKGVDGWRSLSDLAPLLRVDTGSTSSMVEKTAAGEYVAAYLLSGISFFPRLKQPGGEILGFAFPEDGTPLVFRGVAVTENASSPNSARLFLDYLLSNAGQTAVGQGGLTPYREDVQENAVPFYTYQAIAAEVGEESIIHANYNSDHISYTDDFVAQWKSTVTDLER